MLGCQAVELPVGKKKKTLHGVTSSSLSLSPSCLPISLLLLLIVVHFFFFVVVVLLPTLNNNRDDGKVQLQSNS